ncbi:hypothetical protein D9M68_1000900 [compost metagenome]
MLPKAKEPSALRNEVPAVVPSEEPAVMVPRVAKFPLDRNDPNTVLVVAHDCRSWLPDPVVVTCGLIPSAVYAPVPVWATTGEIVSAV